MVHDGGAPANGDAGDEGELGFLDELNQQLLVADGDVLKGEIQRLVLAGPRKDIQVLQHGFALHLHAKDPLTRLAVMHLAELQGDRVGAVGHFDPVPSKVIDARLVHGAEFGPGNDILRETSHLPALADVRRKRLHFDTPTGVRIPAALVPGSLGERHEVRRQNTRAPVNAQQPRATVGLRIRRVPANAAGEELHADQLRVVFQPGNNPLGPVLDPGESRIDEIKAHLPVDAAHRGGLRQIAVKRRAVMLRPEHPAGGGQPERAAEFVQRALRGADVREGRGVVLGLVAAPGPVFGRPQPIIVERVRPGDALEHAFIELLDGGRVGYCQPLLLESLPDGFRDVQRGFRPDAGAHPHDAPKAEGIPEEGAGAVKHRVGLRNPFRQRTKSIGHRRAKFILGKEQPGPGGKFRRPSCRVTPRPAANGAGPSAGIAEFHRAVVVHIFRQPNPDQRLRPHAAFGITMEPGEVQPQLGHLCEVNLVIAGAPPIRPFGEVVEWLNATGVEQRCICLIEVGEGEPDAGVRNDVAIQLETHAELLGEAISAVEHCQVAAAFDPQDFVTVDRGRLQPELLRAK